MHRQGLRIGPEPFELDNWKYKLALTDLKSGKKNTFGEKGMVFNIQRLSTHDGPGIRDLVFLKGCPLRCPWCSNPESQNALPEIALIQKRCIGFDRCGLCVDACGPGAISHGEEGLSIDRKICTSCGDCVLACPAEALTLYGRAYTVDEIVEKVEKDAIFFTRSGGGITVSGGDPIRQVSFVEQLLKRCRDRGIHTALETTGFGSWSRLERILEYSDYILYDIKCMAPDKHQKFTGVSNKTIIENLKKIPERFPNTPIQIRTPIIPGFNDTEEEISAIASLVGKLKTLDGYELNPYHGFGTQKYAQLGRPYKLDHLKSPGKEKMERLNHVAKKALKKVV